MRHLFADLVANLSATLRTRLSAQSRSKILLLLLGVFLPLYSFGKLAEEVWEQDGFSWDEPILRWIHQGATPRLDWVASALT